MQKAYYRDWPLFREYRKTEEFQRTFEEVFEEPFNLVSAKSQETEILPEDEQLLEEEAPPVDEQLLEDEPLTVDEQLLEDEQFLDDEPPPVDE
jgi:hypothetical protein